MKAILTGSLAAAIVAASIGAAVAQDADRQFRRDVRKACMAAASEVLERPRVRLDRVGSESYGMGIVNGVAYDTGERERAICVYNKATGEAEIGSFMPKPKNRKARRKRPDAYETGMPPMPQSTDNPDTMNGAKAN